MSVLNRLASCSFPNLKMFDLIYLRYVPSDDKSSHTVPEKGIEHKGEMFIEPANQRESGNVP